MDVLLDNIEDMGRAAEFSERVSEPAVYIKLGNAYLGNVEKNQVNKKY